MMKKLLLLMLALTVAAMGYTQTTQSNGKYTFVSISDVNNATDDATNFANPVAWVKASTLLAPNETIIGTTDYDLFSNYNVGNRFWVHDDGTMSAVWIFGEPGGASSFPDRGTGYNYYNGTEWGPAPTARLEVDTRTGWPNVAASGDGEFIVNHNGSTSLETLYRPVKGTGDWTQTNFLGPEGIEDALTWPRGWGSGENNEYNHILVCTDGAWNNQTNSLVYSRTPDGGATYDIHNILPDEMGSDYYRELIQDRYVFASNGNTLCMLYVSQETDLFYLRSDDNGDSWDRVIVWEHPIEFYDPAEEYLDTTFMPDMSAHMCIDYNGTAHVVFGIVRYVNDEANGEGIFPDAQDWEGIVYWNENMESFSGEPNALAPPKAGYGDTELIDDYNYIGWLQDLNGDGEVNLIGALPDPPNTARTYGMSTTPAIHVDEWGRKFVIWSAYAETYEYNGSTWAANYKHIFGRASHWGGWGPIVDLTADASHYFDDCVYPMIGNNSFGGNFHYIYQADNGAGIALDGHHDYWENKWIHASVPKSDLITGIDEAAELIDNSHVSQNFPNPFNGTTIVEVSLETASELSLLVTNMTGQKVIEINKGFVTAQTHTFTIDASQLQAGVYFYTVTAGDSQVTKKMIVE